MKTLFRIMNSRLLVLIATFALTFAQGSAQAQTAYSFSQQELDRMVAPIALYPDALLSQILMAATYPLEVAEAASWIRARPGLAGDDAVRAAEWENWDPSVKSLLAFPHVLTRMGEDPQWTQTLGDAFLDQQEEVMETVQALRRRAQAAGSLRSDDRVTVVESGSRLLLQPFDPRVVYVPYYDPLVVYGSWWWPASPPVYWRPWPGYYAQPAYASGFYWGPPVGVSAGFFFGDIDWRQRHVRVAHGNNYYYNRTRVHPANPSPQADANRPGAWRHDPMHRRGLAYRSIEAQRRFNATNAQPAAVAQPMQGDTRFEHRRRDRRATAQPAQPAPVVQPVPAAQPAPVVQPMQGDTRFGHRGGSRAAAPAAQPAPGAQPAAILPPAATAQPAGAAQPAAAAQLPGAPRGNRQAGARAAESRPAPAASRQDSEADPMGRPREARSAPATPRPAPSPSPIADPMGRTGR